MNFSHLECKEILRYITKGIDQEVLAKLLAGSAGATTVIGPGGMPLAPPNAPSEVYATEVSRSPSEGQETAKDDDSWKLCHEPWMDEINPRTGQPNMTQADIDRVNEERRISLVAAHQMSKGIPYTLAAPPKVDARAVIIVTPVGQRNSAGDVCLKIDHNGHSVFQCSNTEHGYYADENPNRIGCTKCFLSGSGTEERESTEVTKKSGYQVEETF